MALPNSRMVQGLQARMVEGFFTDLATVIYRTAGIPDEYGQPAYTEVETEVRCSFTESPRAGRDGTEKWTSYADIEEINAEIRFKGEKPNKGDRVETQSQYYRDGYEEQHYEPQTFEIVGIIDRDTFGYICALKKVSI